MRSVTAELWRGSEAEVRTALDSGTLPSVETVVCLRRCEPRWFGAARLAGAGEVCWIHHPVPPASMEGCRDALLRLCAVWSELETPVLVFCKHGVNRTGMVAAIHLWRKGRPSEALDEYLRGVDNRPREQELELIALLGHRFHSFDQEVARIATRARSVDMLASRGYRFT